MFISLIGFGFLGGISGVMMGTEQLNLIIHNTLYVPGHFHATVVIGTPSITYSGALVALMELPPRISTCIPAPGSPLFWVTWTPAARPWII